jgi:hypothetical protein
VEERAFPIEKGKITTAIVQKKKRNAGDARSVQGSPLPYFDTEPKGSRAGESLSRGRALSAFFL